MPTVCKESTLQKFEFQQAGSRAVQAGFKGGQITSDGGAILLRELACRTGMLEQLADCLVDHRDTEAFGGLFAHWYVSARVEAPPARVILDLDATDTPLHGSQEGKFFHGYYDHYCYLPLYAFAGQHLLWAELRRIKLTLTSGHPWKESFAAVWARLQAAWEP